MSAKKLNNKERGAVVLAIISGLIFFAFVTGKANISRLFETKTQQVIIAPQTTNPNDALVKNQAKKIAKLESDLTKSKKENEELRYKIKQQTNRFDKTTDKLGDEQEKILKDKKDASFALSGLQDKYNAQGLLIQEKDTEITMLKEKKESIQGLYTDLKTTHQEAISIWEKAKIANQKKIPLKQDRGQSSSC